MDQSGGGDNEENKIYPDLPQTDEVKSILNQLNQLKTRRSDLLAELDDIDVKIDQLQGIWFFYIFFPCNTPNEDSGIIISEVPVKQQNVQVSQIISVIDTKSLEDFL